MTWVLPTHHGLQTLCHHRLGEVDRPSKCIESQESSRIQKASSQEVRKATAKQQPVGNRQSHKAWKPSLSKSSGSNRPGSHKAKFQGANQRISHQKHNHGRPDLCWARCGYSLSSAFSVASRTHLEQAIGLWALCNASAAPRSTRRHHLLPSSCPLPWI